MADFGDIVQKYKECLPSKPIELTNYIKLFCIGLYQITFKIQITGHQRMYIVQLWPLI